MRIYITKSKGGFVIHKETTMQSVISDIMSIMVIIVLIGADIVFSLLVTHSFVIDSFVVVLMILYFLVARRNKKQELTKDELIKLIEKI